MLLFSCENEAGDIQRGFYYWKGGDMSITEANSLKELSGERLHIKLFEVTIDAEEGIIPVSKSYMEIPDSLSKELEIIPTIFIENEVIARSTEMELEELAENIIYLNEKYLDEKLIQEGGKKLNSHEIQIDCDWMESSKDKYFFFLRVLKKLTDKTISCTLRLYPYKFTDRMGIPPVDRVMLLCYNLLNPNGNSDKNSILDLNELKKYVETDKDYPLPIDIALPVYSNCFKYVNGQFDEAVHGIPGALESVCLPSDDGLWFTVEADTVLNYSFYKKGQRVKIERVSSEDLLKACEIISDNISLSEGATITLYHLDEQELKQYDHETLDSVFLLFSN